MTTILHIADVCANARAAHAYGLLNAQQDDVRLRVCVYDGRIYLR